MPKKAKQLTPKQVACRSNGRKGGLARALSLTSEQIKSIGSKGGRATHAKLGDDYFSFLAGRRRRIGRYKTLAAEA